jgi:integrase/recombinase XerD
MKEQIKSFEEIEAELLDRMKARGCSSITITGYRYLCNSIISWLRGNGFKSYSEEGGKVFLQNYLDEHGKNQYYTNLRTVVFRLNDLLNNTWKDVHSDKGKYFSISAEYKTIVDKYCDWANNIGLATGTIKYKRYATSWFLHELGRLQCNSTDQLSSKTITVACTRITDHNLWGEIKVFLRYLLEFDMTKVDYSTLVPHYSKPYVIPSVYSVNEISRIENSIDTSTIMGKRDYAMILLASRMGMRSGDIVTLKIEDISNKKEINIVQEKTGNILHLPIIREVQLAIEDYLAVRPLSKIEQLFINVYAPYKAVTTSTLRNALRKYIIAAGIEPGKRKCGPHIFRSSLASSMVNDDISYETVRKILGHSSSNAIKHYARIDIEKLRQYCLKPPAPTGKFQAFLHGEVR